MNPRRLVVGLARLIIVVGYFVFLAIVASIVALDAAIFGVDPLALDGGGAIFAIVVVAELSLVFIFDKPGPVLGVFSLPFIIGQIAIYQAVNSEAIRKLVRRLEDTIRTPLFYPHF
jgi:hypothetical protein